MWWRVLVLAGVPLVVFLGVITGLTWVDDGKYIPSVIVPMIFVQTALTIVARKWVRGEPAEPPVDSRRFPPS